MRKITPCFSRLIPLFTLIILPDLVFSQTNYVPSVIDTDMVLSGTNRVDGNVIVSSNATLQIMPGSVILMNTGATITIYGKLLADGNTNQPIYFTRATTSARWGRLMFIRSKPSVLKGCIFEFSNCSGSHLDYYDNDCNPTTPPPNRTYHEAIVALASHLDIEECTFRNLPDTSSSAEGDAIAIISDDPQYPGAASANIRKCQFLSIGQGVHTRFSYVLVEGCYFMGKRGDNDYVDLYGESDPPPLIIKNIFGTCHDDAINPTRCSAIIIGNIIYGSDDHGVVLRDKSQPVMINNLIYNCTSGGIAVQNQCDALIINNAIINCNRGIRFFDHTTRWGAPYCLNPGSGKATIINTIIWDCPTSLELADSPYTEDRGSHAKVMYCNIKGGRSTASVSANSTLTWGDGNIDANPLFTNTYRLQAGSPCIDAGIDPLIVISNLNILITNDLDGLPRPLDGDNDGIPKYDLGPFEYLNSLADSDNDGIPDWWCVKYGLNPVSNIALNDDDNDGENNYREFVADTNPTDPFSFFRILSFEYAPYPKIYFRSSTNRLYSLYYITNIAKALQTNWLSVENQTNKRGNGGLDFLIDTNTGVQRFYKIGVSMP